MAFTLSLPISDSTTVRAPVLQSYVADSSATTRVAPTLTSLSALSNITQTPLLQAYVVTSNATRVASAVIGAVAESNTTRSAPIFTSLVVDSTATELTPTFSAFVVDSTATELTPTFAAFVCSSTTPRAATQLPVFAAESAWAHYTATIATSVPLPVAALVNPNTYIVLGATLPVARADITVITSTQLSIVSGVPLVSATISIISGANATIGAGMPSSKAVLTGWSATVGAITASVPTPRSSLGGYAAIIGTISAKLAAPHTQISVLSTTSQVLVLVTNLTTKAVTMYLSYPFNSYAKIGEHYYAAGDGGFYQIESAATDGDFDGTALNPIDATFRFGESNFKSEMQKRVSDCYAALRSEGDVTVRVYVDENDPYEYTLSTNNASTLKQYRVPIGKGLKGKYWQFEVENNAGGNFDFDTINIAAVPLSRRI